MDLNRSKVIINQTLPSRIHRPGRVCLRHLGEAHLGNVSNGIVNLHECVHHLRIKVCS